MALHILFPDDGSVRIETFCVALQYVKYSHLTQMELSFYLIVMFTDM
jgi:hypothetical protein